MGLKIISPTTVYLGSATGSGGGGGASFPTIVTDSGSSLPSASGYQLNDTFLNTSDKKIYKTTSNTYEWNTAVAHGEVTIDFTTGIVTNISTGYNNPRILRRTIGNTLWNGNKTYQIKFKMSAFPASGGYYGLFEFANTYSTPSYSRSFGINGDKKIVYVEGHLSYGAFYIDKSEQVVFNTELDTNKEYTITIEKTSSLCKATLFENGAKKEEKNIEVTDFSSVGSDAYMQYGVAYLTSASPSYKNLYTNGQIYLLDSSGDFLVPATELVWDSGVAIEYKSEIADKTNGILYLYENNELVNIPQKNTLSFTNVSASSWVSDSTYADYSYKCELSCSGVTSNMFAQVIFAPTEADSGNYATICLTGTDTVTIYSKVNDTITIPSIVVMGV